MKIASFLLCFLAASVPAVCGYLTSSSFTGNAFVCNLSDNTVCNSLPITANGLYYSPDRSAAVGVSGTGTASAGSLSLLAGGSMYVYSMPTGGLLPPSSAFASENETASSEELWTILTGLGGGFVDIRALVNLNSSSDTSTGTATLQSVSRSVSGFGFIGFLDTGPQPFVDGVPFLVTSSVATYAGAQLRLLFNGSIEAELNNSSVVVTDAHGNVLSDYALTVVPTPEPGTCVLVAVGMLVGGFTLRRLKRRPRPAS